MLKRVGLWSAPVVFILVMFYLPLTKIISLGTSGSWLDVYFQDQTLAAIWFTIWQSAVSTVICLVIAVPGAYILYRKKFAGQKFIRALITVPLVMPSLVVAITFSQFAFVPPIALIITAHVFVNFALMVRTIGGVWLNLDNETEEAAELAGAGRLRTLISITLPQLKPAIIAASALTFLFCSSSYGIILILGDGLVHSIETEVATSALQFLDLQKASALALLQTLLTVVAFGVAESISKNPIGLEQVDETAQKPQLDRRDWFAAVLTGLIVAGLIALPLITVLIKAFTVGDGFGLDNFINLAGRGERDLLNISVGKATLNTLRNVSISATISVSLGTLVAYLLSRDRRSKRSRVFNRVLDVLFLLPVGISSVVLGFGYLITFGSGWLPIRASWLVVPLVQALMAMPLAIRLIYPALVSIGSDHREAAALAGANASQTWWQIETGIIRNVLLTAIGFACVASIGEFGAASLLAYGDQATLPSVLYALISRPGDTNFGMAMAVCAILILITFVLVMLVSSQKPRRSRLGASR